jgi:hypothetical protein
VCPLCAYATASSSVDAVTRNVYVAAQRRRSAGQKSCVNCGEREAAVHCRQCVAALCSVCSDVIHGQQIFQGHELAPQAPMVDRDDANAVASTGVRSALGTSTVQLQCPSHASDAIDMFCSTCRVAICRVCANDAHRSHATQSLETAASTVAAQLPHARTVLTAQSERVRSGAAAVEKFSVAVQAEHDACARETSAAFDRVVDAVRTRQRLLLEQLAAASSKKLALLTEQRDSLVSTGDNLDHSAAVVSLLLDRETAADFPLCTYVNTAASAAPYAKFVAAQRLDLTPCVDREMTFVPGTPIEPTDDASSAAGGTEDVCVSVEQRDILSRVRAFGAIAASTVQHRDLAFEAIGDHAGAMYFLGTSRGIRRYENPAISAEKRVSVDCSSLGYGRPEHIISDGAADFCTNNEPGSWAGVTLEHPLCVAHYVLQHDAFDRDAHFLRHWELQGFDDAEGEWATLSRHVNDRTISERAQGGAWVVTAGRAGGYRRFRVLQTGPNSQGNDYLMLSGFELYGVLLG